MSIIKIKKIFFVVNNHISSLKKNLKCNFFNDTSLKKGDNMEIKCTKCSSTQHIKNGYVFGWQRYKCKNCGYQFTKIGQRGKPMNLILTSHLLYTFGLSIRKIATIIGVSAQSISRWIKKWHQTYMSDIGNNETLYKTNTSKLVDCLNLSPKEEVLIASQNLPSGANIHIIITLPQKH